MVKDSVRTNLVSKTPKVSILRKPSSFTATELLDKLDSGKKVSFNIPDKAPLKK